MINGLLDHRSALFLPYRLGLDQEMVRSHHYLKDLHPILPSSAPNLIDFYGHRRYT